MARPTQIGCCDERLVDLRTGAIPLVVMVKALSLYSTALAKRLPVSTTGCCRYEANI